MGIACDKCGVKSELPEAFFKQRKSFRRGFRIECPQCHAESENHRFRRGLLFNLVLVTLGLALVIAMPQLKSGWVLLNLVLFELFLVGSILPHELGHALVARLLGLRVFKVCIGNGRTLFCCRLFGLDTEFKEVPVGGLTQCAPINTKWFKVKQVTHIFAGPFSNLLLCAITLLFLPLEDAMNIERLGEGLAPGHVFFFTNLMILAQNLWPHTFSSPIGKLSSDGKLIWQTLFMKVGEIEKSLFARYALEAMNCLEHQKQIEAQTWTDEGLARFPDNGILLNLRGILMLEGRNYEGARDCFKSLLAREDNSPGMRGLMLNNIAYASALLGDNESLNEADRFSQEAMSLIGWLPAVKGTRGTTLLQMGRIEESLPLLRESMDKAESTRAKAQNACFIAIGESRRGNVTEARIYLSAAKQLWADCFLLESADMELRKAEDSAASASTACA